MAISPNTHIQQSSDHSTPLPDLRPASIKNQDVPSTPLSFPGPKINNRPTTITLLDPAQLATTPLLVPLQDIVNDAFRCGQLPLNILTGMARIRDPDQLPMQIGSTKGTFTYVVTYARENGPDGNSAGAGKESEEIVLGTLSARPYTIPLLHDGEAPPFSTFVRMKAPVRNREGSQPQNGALSNGDVANKRMQLWELKLMAVDPSLQRQGLAAYLLELAEGEVRRRAANGEGEMKGQNGKEDLETFIVLTTIKETVGEWYARRGYGTDYETWNEPGYMGTEVGFTASHMSKKV